MKKMIFKANVGVALIVLCMCWSGFGQQLDHAFVKVSVFNSISSQNNPFLNPSRVSKTQAGTLKISHY